MNILKNDNWEFIDNSCKSIFLEGKNNKKIVIEKKVNNDNLSFFYLITFYHNDKEKLWKRIKNSSQEEFEISQKFQEVLNIAINKFLEDF